MFSIACFSNALPQYINFKRTGSLPLPASPSPPSAPDEPLPVHAVATSKQTAVNHTSHFLRYATIAAPFLYIECAYIAIIRGSRKERHRIR
jgi:hypothetical protein